MVDRENGEEGESLTVIEWLKSHVRMIVTVVVLLVVAVAIFNLTKERGEEKLAGDSENTGEELTIDIPDEKEVKEATPEAEEIDTAEEVNDEQEKTPEVAGEAVERPASEQKEALEEGKEEASVDREQVSVEGSAQTTDGEILVKAGSGDGLTHLARRAVKEYLAKEGKELSKEQKVYAEDYVRKQMPRERVFTSTEKTISKDTIQTAVEKAQNLQESQLKNLEKYAARVQEI